MLPEFDEMLAQLVAEPSVSSTQADVDRSNVRVIEHLANWLDDIGFETELLPLPNTAGKANLIATLAPNQKPAGREEDNGGLVLAGHTDTVPFDENKWQSDPFALTDQDDRLYGLGTCDMKGFFPLALSAAASFLDAKRSAPITVVATADEESSMAGARYLKERGVPRARYAVIGEPTDLTPVYAHKGIAFLSIRLQGQSGHSSNPELGRNSLDAMHQVMGALLSFRQKLAETHQNPAFSVHIPTLNLGCLHAGDSPNRICSHAELQIDLRLLPGMDTTQTIEHLSQQVQQSIAHLDIQCDITPHYPPIPPFETDPEGDLVRSLSRFSGNPPTTVAFGTEGHFLQSLGMETVVFGAGSIDQAHQPNEYLAREQISPGLNVIQQVIHRYCVD